MTTRDRTINAVLWMALAIYAAVLLFVVDAAFEESFPPIEPGYIVVNGDAAVHDCYVYEDETWGCFDDGDPREPVGRVPIWTGPFDKSSEAYEVWTQGGDLR